MIKFISLNGTSRQELMQTRLDVVAKLREALSLLGRTAPHRRDYVGDDEGYTLDRITFDDRNHHVIEIIGFIEVEAEAIHDLPGRP